MVCNACNKLNLLSSVWGIHILLVILIFHSTRVDALFLRIYDLVVQDGGLLSCGGRFLHLTPAESNAVHECLSWARQGGNNRVLTFFGTVMESFQAACTHLLSKFKSVIPEGSSRARIRATRRESRQPHEEQLGSTLGEEGFGLVVVDCTGMPMKYDKLKASVNKGESGESTAFKKQFVHHSFAVSSFCLLALVSPGDGRSGRYPGHEAGVSAKTNQSISLSRKACFTRDRAASLRKDRGRRSRSRRQRMAADWIFD